MHAKVQRRLDASGGLSAVVEGDEVRIAYGGHEDWFGAGSLRVGGSKRSLVDGRSVRGVDDIGEWDALVWVGDRGASPRIDASLAAHRDRPILTFSLRAPVGAEAGLSTGSFDEPGVVWPALAPSERRRGGLPAEASAFGFQSMEFGLPTATGPDLAGWTRWPVRPAVMMPLLVVTEVGTLMLAPLDAFHEQVIAVPDGDDVTHGVRVGWHGDLVRVPAGFSTEMAVIAGTDARDCLDTWAAILVDRAEVERLPRGIDALGSHVSYWTDNGAAYWYRTEGGRSVTDTLSDTLADLRERDVPYRSVQLDSWFYPHREVRPFDTEEWDVPPTGLMEWQARADILPDGVGALADALGSPPLVAHCRHLSAESPYVGLHECWLDGDHAHPVGPELYETYLDQAVRWGVETFEHDWLVECFLGVRGLRAEPGRVADWQRGLDSALRERGMTAQWCMATPADMMAAAALPQVTSVRTSGDHGYLVPPELLWAWFLYTNALVRPLGLWPYKDVFRSDGHGGSTDPGAEAALAALSAGPVGIGDALGGADRDLVLRTCRRDGLLVAPDAPIAAIARCFARHGVLQPEPMVGATHTVHQAGRWSYVMVMNCHDGSEHMGTRVSPAELGEDAPRGADDAATVMARNWRTGEVAELGDDGLAVELGAKGWALHVLAPILCGGRLALFGDPDRYASMGRQRIASVVERNGSLRTRVAGHDEVVHLVGWASGPITATVLTGGPSGPAIAHTLVPAGDGAWELTLELPAEPGWVQVELDLLAELRGAEGL